VNALAAQTPTCATAVPSASTAAQARKLERRLKTYSR
jgi:hypothetical protein